MYEEEDDDLPFKYRQLTAHLQTGSSEFNRRLAAYLTNQVAMRSALDQMVGQSYPQQFAGQFPQQQNMFQSPMMQQPQTPQSPMSPYRQAPYPSPHHPNFRAMQGRSYSTVVPNHQGSSTSGQAFDHRRMSTPASMPPTPGAIQTDGMKYDTDYMRQTQSATLQQGPFPPLWQDMGPFTTTLPPESQQMLGPALDQNDPFQASLMNGAENFTNHPYYPWGNMSQGIKCMPVHPSAYQGMSATLAPAALTSHSEAVSSATTPGTSAALHLPEAAAPSSGLDFNFSQESKGLNLQDLPNMADGHLSSRPGSGQVTPGEAFWENFVQDENWEENATQ
jgi:hypothetical protein